MYIVKIFSIEILKEQRNACKDLSVWKVLVIWKMFHHSQNQVYVFEYCLESEDWTAPAKLC